jgi:hypothetical protein
MAKSKGKGAKETQGFWLVFSGQIGNSFKGRNCLRFGAAKAKI